MNKAHLPLVVFVFLIALSTTAQKTTVKSQVTTFDVIAVIQAKVTARKSKNHGIDRFIRCF